MIGTPQDRLVRVDDVQRTAELHGVEPVWFPGMGHDVMLDVGWDRVLDTVLRVRRRPAGLGRTPGELTASARQPARTAPVSASTPPWA